MVKWEELANPRDHGGLGFTDTRLMNECLLAKWIIKLEMLRKIYLRGKGFLSSKPGGVSQFWKGLHDIKFTCQRGMKYIVGSGRKHRIWHEVWMGDYPLRI
jgi:hypothetical protein